MIKVQESMGGKLVGLCEFFKGPMKLGNDPLPKGRTFSPPPWKFVVLHYRRDGSGWARVRVCKGDMRIIAGWISVT